MKTICLLAQKGGTGKTTLCLHLAVLAGELGHDAAVVDIDPQASASAWKRRRQRDTPEVLRREVGDLAGVLADSGREGKDLVLLDTAPHSSHEAATAAFGRELLDALPADLAGWTLLLSGELGAGKSTFARAFIHGAGHGGAVPRAPGGPFGGGIVAARRPR